MMSDAYVTVTCDICDASEDIELTPLAGGGWDARNVKRLLERDGWLVDGDHHTCPECHEDTTDE